MIKEAVYNNSSVITEAAYNISVIPEAVYNKSSVITEAAYNICDKRSCL